MKTTIIATLALGLSASAISAAQFYSSEDYDDFSTATSAASHLETFASVSEGPVSSPYSTAGTDGFEWDLTSGSLYALGSGVMSTDFHTDSFLFTFTGRDVFAFGGNFWGSDAFGVPLLANILFQASTGDSIISSASSSSNFIGIITTEPLEWVSVSATSPSNFNTWVTGTQVVTAIPEPGTTALLWGAVAIGAGIFWRRKGSIATRKTDRAQTGSAS